MDETLQQQQLRIAREKQQSDAAHAEYWRRMAEKAQRPATTQAGKGN